MRWTVVAVAIALAAGCSKKKDPPPTCAAIVDKMMGFIKGNLGGEVGDKPGMVAQCEKEFSDDLKRCLGEAADLNAVVVCRGGKPTKGRPGIPVDKDKSAPVDPHKDMKP
jgi:hypothetical protein